MSQRSSQRPPRGETARPGPALQPPAALRRRSASPKAGPTSSSKRLERAEKLGLRPDRLFRPAPTAVAEAGPHPAAGGLQRKYQYKGFDPNSTKLGDLVNALEGSENKYLAYLSRSAQADVRVNLESKLDPNPGDATFYFKRKGSDEWEGSLAEMRKATEITNILVVVNIRRWYFNTHSSGKVLAMLAHEVGVHIVPYMDELLSKLPESKIAKPDPKFIDKTKQPGAFGREDHLRVADVNHVDFELYQGVVKDMMAAVAKQNPRGGQKAADELADAYLMDISTFAKSGARIKSPLDAGAVATKYNAYRKKTGLEKNVPEKSASQVWADYTLLYTKVFAGIAQTNTTTKIVALITLFLLVYFFYWLVTAGWELVFG